MNWRAHLIPILSAAMLVALMFLFSVHTLTSIYQDIGRHIRMGDIIWNTHQIPRTNLFSYTNPNFPFIDHHWFAEVLIYLGDRTVGLQGLILIKAFLMALAFGLALAAAWRPRMALAALVIGLVSIFILIERTDVRPEILSFVFLGWFLFVLYRYPNSRLVWTLPVVQLLWVNSHIYFFMGPFLWLAFLAGKKITREHIALTVLIALATLANPWGLAGALYPLRILSHYGYSIVENKSPFFLASYGYPQLTSIALYLGIVLTAASCIINIRRLRQNLFGLIIAIGTAVLALVMIRNFPLFALVMMPVILTNLDQAGWHSTSRQWLVMGMVLIGLLGISVVTNQIYNDAGLNRQFGLNIPMGFQESIALYRSAGLKGPLFNNFDIGSFLIWQLPQEPVFIDGRPEAYPEDFIKNVYIAMQQDPTAWQIYSERYKLNTIFWNYWDLTPWSQAFTARILQDSQWELLYRAHGIMILTRK